MKKSFVVHFLKSSTILDGEEEPRHRWKFICDGTEMVVDEIVMNVPVKTVVRSVTPLGVIAGEGAYIISYFGEGNDKRLRVTIE